MSYPTQRNPPQQPPYPPQQPSYPPQQSPYPPQQPSYPPQQPSYPPQQPSYPPQQSSYPPEQPSYPPQQPNAAVQVLPNHLGFQTTSLGGGPPFNNDVDSSEPPVVAPPQRKKGGKFLGAIICGGICLFLILLIALPLFIGIRMMGDAISQLRPSAPRELGCIPKRDLTYGEDSLSSSSLTTFQCLQFCHARSLQYASIHNGEHCSCTDLNLSANKDFVGDYNCNTPCSGRAEELNCGGPQHESVFEVGSNLIVKVDEWQYTIVPFYLKWNQSRAYCQSIGTGGDLAVAGMQDLSKRRMILNSLHPGHKVNFINDYWIGLTYSTSDGTWVWNNGETGGTHWETDIDGEPDKGRCATVRQSADWLGLARHCNGDKDKGVCQYKL